MNSPSLTPEQMQALLGFAAARLGCTPQALASTLQEGGLASLQQKLSPQEDSLVRQLLGDRAAAEAFLASPDVQALLSRIRRD